MSASLAPECNEVKEKYDTCFLKWYSEKYLRGAASSENNECAALFKNYQKCLGVALKQRGIDKLLDEARDDNKENDAVYLGRKYVSSTRSTRRGRSGVCPSLLALSVLAALIFAFFLTLIVMGTTVDTVKSSITV
ncbi:UPF0203-domain-containing protein [Coniochaeta ligniaria NRRL 30616]|uniref:UPF0203-domain-containing protein n=1 Tax=Coniochaeta ligniaria NRRL 30616 TaxID=1408157 RepID=A0A1J7J9M8_9PEZI|nr:UPF0203-domain-containing protein [Coniochaeta ligniaria NRRL 30616]